MSPNLNASSAMPGTRLANHLAGISGRDAASTPSTGFQDHFPAIEKYKDEPGASEPLAIDGDDPQPQPPNTVATAFSRASILGGFAAVIVVLTIVFVVGGTGKDDQAITSSEATLGVYTSELENDNSAPRLPDGLNILPVTPAPAPTEDANPEPTMVEPSSAEEKKRHTGCVFSVDHDSARFENEHYDKHNRLYAGQFICSQNHTNEGVEHHRYQFGVSNRGDLVLKDRMVQQLRRTNNKYDRILYHHPKGDPGVGDDYHLSLKTDGTLMMHASAVHDKHQWSLTPNRELHLTEHCLDNHDCPYLHLHADGVLVVNYIDDNNTWQHKDFFKVYDI